MPTLSAPFFKTHRNISDPCGTISPVNSERQVWAEMSVVHSTHQLIDVYKRQVQGTWLITDVFMTGEVIAFAPIFFWKRIRRGISDTLTKLLIGWRCLTRALAEKAVGA